MEQLEVGFGHSNRGGRITSRQASTEFPEVSAQYKAGDKPYFQGIPMTWPACGLPSYAPSVLYQPMFTGVFPQPFLAGEASGATFLGKAKEDLLFDVGTNNDNIYAAGSPPVYSNNEQDMHVPITGSMESRIGVNSNDMWETPKRSSSDIHRIYRQIADALEHGSSVEGLLQELAAVTAKSARSNGESTRGSPKSRPTGMSRPHTATGSPASKGSNAQTNELRESSMSSFIGDKSGESIGISQLCEQTPESERTHGNGFHGAVASDEDDESFSSSYISTNSWGTIQDSG